MEERELLLERLELAFLRIREIPGEDWQGEALQPWREYFGSDKVSASDRRQQKIPGTGWFENGHVGRITAAQPCPV